MCPSRLAVNKVGETVDVSAEAPMLQTDRTSVSGAVGAEMIEALPNITQNPRAYAYLQALRAAAQCGQRHAERQLVWHRRGRAASSSRRSASTAAAPSRTTSTANPALGLVPGMGNSNSYGTRGMATFNPRQIQLGRH